MKKHVTLVVMAAGMGSRYGGLKQIDPIGPCREIIMDYSVYDAIEAGFDKVVFVIKREIEAEIRQLIGDRIAKQVRVEYVYQDLQRLPSGYSVPEGRTKPWGTGHAVLCCKDVVHEPFAVINADDYYGKEAFSLLYQELSQADENATPYPFCMVGYDVANTLTENGFVARGVCEINDKMQLTNITERTKIKQQEGKIVYTENDGESYTEIPENSTVSMNFWGFVPKMLEELENRFAAFLDQNQANIQKAEYFLPFVVNELIQEKKAVVTVLKTSEKWYGVTYKEDRERVAAAFEAMTESGKYPKGLWNQ